MSKERPSGTPFTTGCSVCARPLVYATESVTMVCSFCGKTANTPIYCPAGHYICDSCHSKAALDVLRSVIATSGTTDPGLIIEQVVSHPSVPMHGPEHHSIVPAAIVASVRNTGYALPQGALERALERAGKVPGGWCGLYGACGAAIGVGLAVSVITGATPLTGKTRTLALAATSFTLSHMLDEEPRCCKRASSIAASAATEFLADRLGIFLAKSEKVRCIHSWRNPQCARERCAFFGQGAPHTGASNLEIAL